MNGNRKQHGSIERVLNLAQMAKGDSLPESLRQQFQRQLAEEKLKIEQLLEIDTEVNHPPQTDLQAYADSLNKRINKYFREREEDDDDNE